MDDEIIRVARRERFAIIDQETIRDKRLSFGARGLLHYLLSLPDNWKVNLTHLVGQSPAGPAAVKTLVKELKGFRYMARLRFRVSGGKFKWKTIVAERPMTDDVIRFYERPGQLELLESSPVVDFPLVAGPPVESPVSGSPVAGSSTSGEPPPIRKIEEGRSGNEGSNTKDFLEVMPFSSPEFCAAWSAYVKVRKEKKKAVTQTIAERLAKKIVKWGEVESTRALNMSADNGWTGVDPEWGAKDAGRIPSAKMDRTTSAVESLLEQQKQKRSSVANT